jgi:hypothetical protein
MPFIFKPLSRYETKELIREFRDVSVTVVMLQYDLNYAIYLNQPEKIKLGILLELADYKEYKLQLKKELERRV